MEGKNLDLADFKVVDEEKLLIAQVTSAIEDLLAKVNQKEKRNFKEIVLAISQFSKWLRQEHTASKPIAVQCFVRHPEVVTALVTMVEDDICTGVLKNNIITFEISYDCAYCAMMVHEFFRILTDASNAVLMEAARAGFVHVMLRELSVLKANLGHSKVLNLLVTAIFGVIQNFAVKPELLMYFKSTKFNEIISAYLNIDDKVVYLLCLITLTSLIEIIPNRNLNTLVFSSEEVSSFVEILCEASTEPDLTAREVYGSCVVPVEDTLKLFKHLCYVEANRAIIKEHILMILMSIELCINNGTSDHVLVALDLLWTLVSELSLSSDDLDQNVSTLLTTIDRLAKERVKSSISSIALCIQYTLTPLEAKDSGLLLVLSEGAYQHRRYERCIQWCGMLVTCTESEKSNSTKALAKALSGKSYFHIYRRKQQLFQEVQPELSAKEFHLQSDAVYSKAKRAIIDLGEVFETDPSVIDEEGLQFLDISIIDLVCHTNGLKDIARCLLCQKKSKLLRSHLCPDAILRAFATGLEETQTKRIFSLSFFKDSEMKSPHTIVKWLFCQNCEGILCKDGEAYFVPKFFRKTYDARSYQHPSEEMTINYGEWLYRFALGIVFRSLVNEAITSFINEDEIYTLFIQCRNLLLTKNLMVEGLKKPCIYLLVSPDNPSTGAGLIGNLHNSPFVFALTDKSLKTGKQTISCAHFLLSRIGIFNFLVLFKPADPTLIADECIIQPEGGKFIIPSESAREKMIPKGVSSVLDGLAVVSQKNIIEMDKATVYALHKTLNDSVVSPSELAKETYGTLPALENDFDRIFKGELTNHFSLKNPQNINLLPKGMAINYEKDLIILPENHSVILHGTLQGKTDRNDSYKGTLFLVSGDNPLEPYVLMLCMKPGLTVSLGYVVSPDTLFPLKLLQDQNPKAFLPAMANHLNAFTFIHTALPHFLKMKGLKTYHTVIHHSYLKWAVVYDIVCEKRCWYCDQRCNNCLKLSFSSYNTSHPSMPLMKFCGKTCQDTYTLGQLPPSPESNISPHLMLFDKSFPLALKPNGFIYARLGVFLGDGSKSFSKNDAYVVYQHRAPFSQIFLEYFMTNDFSIRKPLMYYSDEDSEEVLQSQEVHTVYIRLALAAEMKEMKIKDLNELIDVKLESENQH